ncbi:MAG: COG1470 family protein [Planctomycetota bacterium]
MLTCLVFVMASATADSVRQLESEPATFSPHATNRVVFSFDFDERDEGNLENVPKFWRRVEMPTFPHFSEGVFDDNVGNQSPPSFALKCSGRNIAFEYEGPDTRIRRNTDYRIEGYIRTSNLRVSRACLSACFVDGQGQPIPGTLARSRFVGDVDSGNDWVHVEFHLPAAPVHARTIGMIAWVLQEDAWNNVARARRHIPRRDVHAVAFFDDITIYALPKVELKATTPGNVLATDEDPTLRIVVADFEDSTLTANLSIFAADGSLAATQSIKPSVGIDTKPVYVSLLELDPGLYTAQLTVYSGRLEVIRRTLDFARVGPMGHASAPAGRPLGVVLDPRQRADTATELALLQNLGIGSAKIPVWSGLPEASPDRKKKADMDQFLQELLRTGFLVTAVFAGPPGPVVQQDGPYPRPLLELLAGPPSSWQDHLAAVVVPYAGIFDRWQIGPDYEKDLPNMEQLEIAIEQLRSAMRQFITVPRLGLTTQAWHGPQDVVSRIDHHTLALGAEVSPKDVSTVMASSRGDSQQQVSLFIDQFENAHAFQRLPLLASWAQRIIHARYAGASTVYVRQPWTVRDTVQGKVAEPTESYLVLRTIARSLGTATPSHALYLAPDVTCLTFQTGKRSTLVLWDDRAPMEGRDHALQLGNADHYLDTWGKTHALDRLPDGRHRIRLSPMPLIVPDVDRWLVELCHGISVNPQLVTTGTELSDHQVMIQYRGAKPLSGEFVLDGPESWKINRQSRSLLVTPQRATTLDYRLHIPHNAVAGEATLLARISLERPEYYFELPLQLQRGLLDVDVSAAAYVEGQNVILSHVVTNRSDETLDLRSTAGVPGRERQYRPFANLAPGETQTVEYRFRNGPSISGTQVNLSLRELNDGPRVHNLAIIMP